MSTINNIKQLISEGKTKEALDTFQTLLEGSGREEFNQSLLLESQYMEVIKKAQLGLLDANVEVSRINFALLSLCDQVDILEIRDNKIDRKTTEAEKSNNKSIINALILFIIFIVIVLAIVFFVVKNV
jgi:subtilase family serine protease